MGIVLAGVFICVSLFGLHQGYVETRSTKQRFYRETRPFKFWSVIGFFWLLAALALVSDFIPHKHR